MAEVTGYKRKLVEAIGELPEEYQRILQMRLVDECSPEEAAAALGIHEFEAETLCFAGLCLLRNVLAKVRPSQF